MNSSNRGRRGIVQATRLPLTSFSQQFRETTCVQWRGALLVVIEINKNVVASGAPWRDLSTPRRKSSRLVTAAVPSGRAVATDVDEIRRTLPRRGSIRVIRDT